MRASIFLISFIVCLFVDKYKSEISSFVKEWSSKSFLGEFKIPVSLLTSPLEDIRSRHLDMNHIHTLIESFRSYSRVNEDIQVVLRTEKKRPQTLSVGKLKGLGVPFEVIAGNHSVHALKSLHSEYPRNPLFAEPKCKVFLCQNTLDNRSAIRALGGLDNVIKGIHRLPTKTEAVLAMHEQLKHESDSRVNLAKLKKEWRVVYCNNTNTLNTMIGIAKKDGEVWDLISQILTGQGMPEKYRPPTTIAKFNQMGGVDHNWLLDQLRLVKDCTISLAQFHARCLSLKNAKKVREWIAQLIRSTGQKDELETKNWAELAKLYPNTCRESFVESWLNVAASRAAKYGPPDSIKIAVTQWMQVDEAIQKPVRNI